MKVLNIMLSRGLGGIQQAFLDYNAALALQNVKVINVTSYKAEINALLPAKSFKLPNLSPIDLFVLILKYIIYKIKPDIIIAHGNKAINFSKLAKPRVLKLIGIAHNYRLKSLRKCDHIIALTQHMKAHLLANNFSDSKIFVLPNMININKDFDANKIYRRPIVIGMLARLVPKKGADVFIRAMYILKNQGYEFEAIIGGDGAEKENLLALTRKLNLENDIDFPGWIQKKDEFFKQLDIFCLPSLHEPFGIIALEAMESSVPIVSTDTEGPSEIIKHMKEGLICAKALENDLAEKIAYLISRPEVSSKLAKAAYLRLKENYDINVVGKALVTFCNILKIDIS